MSENTKISYRPVLGDIWNGMLANIAKDRPFNITEINQIVDAKNYPGIIGADKAVKEKIIDHATHFIVLERKLAQKYTSDEKTLSFLAIQDTDYASAEGIGGIANVVSKVYDDDGVGEGSNNIAVIVLAGAIMPGEKSPGQIGSLSAVKLLRKARLDSTVKAVVLRVDSPGGSAMASDRIRDEILELKKSGKPVVISMGSLCASGGYWLSSAGDYLIAQKDTVTGSIGVFGLYTSLSSLMQRFHVNVDGLGTTSASNSGRIDMPMNQNFNDAMQNNVNRIYHKFLTLVKEGRGNKITDKVDDLAQGRIWDASQALKNGLIDKIGGLNDAINKAADIAGLSGFGVKVISQEISMSDRLRWQITKQLESKTGNILSQVESKITKLESESGKAMALSSEIRSDGLYGQ